MSHPRTLIRHAVVALLTGATSAEDRVHASRHIPYTLDELPSISVYTLEETVTADSVNSAPRELTRELPIVIEGWVAPSTNPDEAMDDIALEIETAMHADPYLGDTVAESVLEGTTLDIVVDGDREMGLATLTYAATYRTQAPETDEDLDDFETVDAEYNLGNAVDAGDVAQDIFAVEDS